MTRNKPTRRQELRSDIGWLSFILLGWLLLLAPGHIDGTSNPVVAPLVIRHVEAVDDKWTEFTGTSRKLRQCSFRRVEWYLGTRDKPNVPVPVVMGEPQIRLRGPMLIEDWRIKIAPPDRIWSETFADVFHQCSLWGVDLPWLTKTRFWN